MKKILFILFLIISTPVFAANNWFQGTGTAPLQGTTLINNIDVDSANYAFNPLDRLLTNYKQSMVLSYANAATLSVSAGEIVVKDSGGTIKLMLQNTTSTTLTWADIDTGSEAASTTYYVYAIAASSSSTTATFKISLSATAPSGVTYYKRLGSFYNDASSNIGNIVNDLGSLYFGDKSTKTINATYQALTNGYVSSSANAGDTATTMCLYSDSVSTPTTIIQCSATHDIDGAHLIHVSGFVRAGDYYKVTIDAGGSSSTTYFMPILN